MAEGIEVRHQRTCATLRGRKRCDCTPSYRASVWDPGAGRHLRSTHASRSAARLWRADALKGIAERLVSARTTPTINEAAAEMIAGMKEGTIRARTGRAYKHTTIRSYEQSLALHVLDDLGPVRLHELTRGQVQSIVDRMTREKCSASAIRNAVMPLRVVLRRALRSGQITVNPLSHLDLPAAGGRRHGIVDHNHAARLIAAAPDTDRTAWALAAWAGLRRGEILGLACEAVDIEAGIIRVEQAWDPTSGSMVEPKSEAGRRNVPVVAQLRPLLTAQLASASGGLLFPSVTNPARPMDASGLASRAREAWARHELQPAGLHDLRHTFASICIAAGLNAKAISVYMGHSHISTTFDVYGHLMPGSESEAADLLDAFLGSAAAGREEGKQ